MKYLHCKKLFRIIKIVKVCSRSEEAVLNVYMWRNWTFWYFIKNWIDEKWFAVIYVFLDICRRNFPILIKVCVQKLSWGDCLTSCLVNEESHYIKLWKSTYPYIYNKKYGLEYLQGVITKSKLRNFCSKINCQFLGCCITFIISHI